MDKAIIPARQKPGYRYLHEKLQNHRGKAASCVWGCTNVFRYEWANLTGDYDDPMDFAAMCTGCHRRFDQSVQKTLGNFRSNNSKFTVDQILSMRAAYRARESQASIAKRFGTTQSNVGNIVNYITWRWVA
jgi:cellulose synthase/poly-beta-1,6-N-acetylglucosamine synthase-like glycosyltransferase